MGRKAAGESFKLGGKSKRTLMKERIGEMSSDWTRGVGWVGNASRYWEQKKIRESADVSYGSVCFVISVCRMQVNGEPAHGEGDERRQSKESMTRREGGGWVRKGCGAQRRETPMLEEGRGKRGGLRCG